MSRPETRLPTQRTLLDALSRYRPLDYNRWSEVRAAKVFVVGEIANELGYKQVKEVALRMHLEAMSRTTQKFDAWDVLRRTQPVGAMFSGNIDIIRDRLASSETGKRSPV